jgi:hypothetical protein
MAQWKSTWLASVRPQVQIPVPQKDKEKIYISELMD